MFRMIKECSTYQIGARFKETKYKRYQCFESKNDLRIRGLSLCKFLNRPASFSESTRSFSNYFKAIWLRLNLNLKFLIEKQGH